ncbi:MAG: SDR family oxidoreductase [Tabrizicola flagellatus]|uniref:SDR family oxidoreductase n=1 Tax=Tabrizicola flagellatus TaxID=2593021 RepID=UPI00391D5E83
MGEHHLRINTIVPGWVLTERQLRDHFHAEGEQLLHQKQSLVGTIRPEDVAALALFLASDDSAMCSGQEFTIDGDWI